MTNYIRDVKADYGATGDGFTDDADAIQHAFDEIYDHPEQPSHTVFFPPVSSSNGEENGYYKLGHPLFTRKMGTRILGSYQTLNGAVCGGSKLFPSYAYGPTLVVDEGSRQIDLVTALVPFPGGTINDPNTKALRRQNTWASPYNHEGNQFFDLRDAATLELDGLEKITVELFLKIPSTYEDIEVHPTDLDPNNHTINNQDSWIISSYGRFFNHELTNIFDGCFVLKVSGGVPSVDLLITRDHKTNEVFTVLPYSGQNNEFIIADDTIHHVAFDFDGAVANPMLRVYVDGAIMGSTAIPRVNNLPVKLVQHPAEGVNFGLHFSLQPMVQVIVGCPMGIYDSIRISKIARYAGVSFNKPMAKFTKLLPNNNPDTDLLCLMNFDRNIGPITRAETKDGDFWAYMRGNPNPTHPHFTQPMGWNIEGISIQGKDTYPFQSSGIFIGTASHAGRIARVSLDNMRIGMMVGTTADSYDWRMEEVNIRAKTGRYAYLGGKNDALSQFDTCWFFGGMVGYFSQNMGKLFNNCVWEIDPLSMYPLIMQNLDIIAGGCILNRCSFSTEGGLSEDYFKALVTINAHGTGPTMSSFNGCVFVVNGINKPHISVAGPVGPITFENCGFWNWTDPNKANDPKVGPNTPPNVMIEEIVKVLDLPHPPAHAILFHNCKQHDYWTKWSTTIGATTAIVPGLVFVPFPATFPMKFDASLGSVFVVTLTDDVISSELINVSDGQVITFIIKQDVVGGHKFTHPTTVQRFGRIPKRPNAIYRQSFVFDGTMVV